MYYFSEARRKARAADRLAGLERMDARLKAMEQELEAKGLDPDNDADYCALVAKLAAGMAALDVATEGLT